MNNVTFIDITNSDGTITTSAIIDKGNGEFTSMLKSTYDTLVSNSSTPQAGN
jgi:hypothetical protein